MQPTVIVKATEGVELEILDRERYDEMRLDLGGPTARPFEDGVSEPPVGYGSEDRYHTSELGPVLKRVGKYLEELERVGASCLTANSR